MGEERGEDGRRQCERFIVTFGLRLEEMWTGEWDRVRGDTGRSFGKVLALHTTTFLILVMFGVRSEKVDEVRGGRCMGEATGRLIVTSL